MNLKIHWIYEYVCLNKPKNATWTQIIKLAHRIIISFTLPSPSCSILFLIQFISLLRYLFSLHTNPSCSFYVSHNQTFPYLNISDSVFCVFSICFIPSFFSFSSIFGLFLCCSVLPFVVQRINCTCRHSHVQWCKHPMRVQVYYF